MEGESWDGGRGSGDVILNNTKNKFDFFRRYIFIFKSGRRARKE